MNLEQYVANKKYQVDIHIQKHFEKEELPYQAYYYACMMESDVNVLKTIIKKYFIDVKKLVVNMSAFYLACLFNKKVNIIKFFVNDLKFDINCNRENIYLSACAYNNNIDIIKYLNQDLYKNCFDKNNILKNGLYYAIRYNKDVEIIELFN